MGQPIAESRSRVPRPVLALAGALGLLMAATGALWAYYGTAVFYEMIVAGLATCL